MLTLLSAALALPILLFFFAGLLVLVGLVKLIQWIANL